MLCFISYCSFVQNKRGTQAPGRMLSQQPGCHCHQPRCCHIALGRKRQPGHRAHPSGFQKRLCSPHWGTKRTLLANAALEQAEGQGKGEEATLLSPPFQPPRCPEMLRCNLGGSSTLKCGKLQNQMSRAVFHVNRVHEAPDVFLIHLYLWVRNMQISPTSASKPVA